jgi:hypothetical protein
MEWISEAELGDHRGGHRLLDRRNLHRRDRKCSGRKLHGVGRCHTEAVIWSVAGRRMILMTMARWLMRPGIEGVYRTARNALELSQSQEQDKSEDEFAFQHLTSTCRIAPGGVSWELGYKKQ